MGEPKKVKGYQVRWTAGGEAVPAFMVSEVLEVQADGRLRRTGGLELETWEELTRRHALYPTRRAAALAYVARRQAQVYEHAKLLREAQQLALAAGALKKPVRRKRRAS